MTDEQNQAPAEADSAISTAPQGETTTEAIDWERRALDHQAAFTRASQELAERKQWEEQIRTDPEAHASFVREAGIYDLEDDSPDLPLTELDELRAQVAELRGELEPVKQTHEQAEEARQIASIDQSIGNDLAEIAAGGVSLSQKKRELIAQLALTLPGREDGMPDVRAAYDAITEVWKEDEQQGAANRRPTHTFTPGGVPGEDKPDLTTHEGRVANAMAKLADTA